MWLGSGLELGSKGSSVKECYGIVWNAMESIRPIPVSSASTQFCGFGFSERYCSPRNHSNIAPLLQSLRRYWTSCIPSFKLFKWTRGMLKVQYHVNFHNTTPQSRRLQDSLPIHCSCAPGLVSHYPCFERNVWILQTWHNRSPQLWTGTLSC